MSTTIARDPFARGAYRRWTHANTARRHRCRWCGAAPRRLVSYAWEPDDGWGEASDSDWWFCNKQCRDAYHG